MAELTITAETQTPEPQQIVRIKGGEFHATYYVDRRYLFVSTPKHSVIGPIDLSELSELVKFLICVYAEFKPGGANGE